MGMSGQIGRDGFCSFEVIVDFLSIEYGEDAFASRMHEILVNIVHGIIDNDVAHSP